MKKNPFKTQILNQVLDEIEQKNFFEAAYGYGDDTEDAQDALSCVQEVLGSHAISYKNGTKLIPLLHEILMNVRKGAAYLALEYADHLISQTNKPKEVTDAKTKRGIRPQNLKRQKSKKGASAPAGDGQH